MNLKSFSILYYTGPLGYPVRTVTLPPEVPAIDNPLVVGAIAALIIPLGALFTWFLLGNCSYFVREGGNIGILSY